MSAVMCRAFKWGENLEHHHPPLPLTLSHHYSACPPDPSVSPRRSHHSPSFSLPSLPVSPSSFHVDPFCSQLFVAAVVVSPRVGDGGPVSCFLCPSVCLDSVGMRVRKSCRRVQVDPQSVCVWRRGHTWCGSIHRTCSWELNCSGKFVLVCFIFLLGFFWFSSLAC